MLSTALSQTTNLCLPLTAMQISNLAIPFGSTVVVIGANSYIAMETCVKLLEAGFRVRGTVRDVQQHRGWMHKLFAQHGVPCLSLCKCPISRQTRLSMSPFKVRTLHQYTLNVQVLERVHRLQVPQEISMFQHLCFLLFDTDPAKVIGPTVNGTINILEAAARAGVKRCVLAGSSKAVATNLKKISRHVGAEGLNGL
jgi:nucleoside-diphosphate-sugar epimerase